MWVQQTEDKGLWNEYINDVTGESSIKEHKPKIIWKGCKPEDHYWEMTGNREITCKHCHQKSTFIVGLQKIVDGEIIPI